MKNINEERIEINENGVCETFERGVSPIYKEEHDSKLEMTLEEIEPTVRTYNCLKRAGINTVGDLINKTIGDLQRIRNMGQKSVKEIEELLGKLELGLRKD